MKVMQSSDGFWYLKHKDGPLVKRSTYHTYDDIVVLDGQGLAKCRSEKTALALMLQDMFDPIIVASSAPEYPEPPVPGEPIPGLSLPGIVSHAAPAIASPLIAPPAAPGETSEAKPQARRGRGRGRRKVRRTHA